MQNSKKSEKSKGVILFAFNTKVDYVDIADHASQLIQRNLKLPITLVTDADTNPKFEYDHVIRVDTAPATFRNSDGSIPWRNRGRYTAYELSPYDSTLLLDVDYLVFDNSLLKVLNSTEDYRLVHHSYTDSGMQYSMMGETSLPYVWATAVAFNKTERSHLLFELVGRIQRNYHYYRALYNIREGNFRNDYAFAIANNILSGYSLNEQQGMPWPMYTVVEDIQDIRFDGHKFLRIYYKDRATVIPQMNLHVMDKEYLQSENFRRLIRNYCGQD